MILALTWIMQRYKTINRHMKRYTMKKQISKHQMIILMDQVRADVYKEVAKQHGKNLSQWVRIILDQACRQAGHEPESVLNDLSQHD
jgi:hypothetical protein